MDEQARGSSFYKNQNPPFEDCRFVPSLPRKNHPVHHPVKYDD